MWKHILYLMQRHQIARKGLYYTQAKNMATVMLLSIKLQTSHSESLTNVE